MLLASEFVLFEVAGIRIDSVIGGVFERSSGASLGNNVAPASMSAFVDGIVHSLSPLSVLWIGLSSSSVSCTIADDTVSLSQLLSVSSAASAAAAASSSDVPLEDSESDTFSLDSSSSDSLYSSSSPSPPFSKSSLSERSS